MKFQLVKLFTGVVTLTFISTATVFSLAQQSASAMPAPPEMVSMLKLTPSQQSSLGQLEQSTQTQIEAILTPAQKEQMAILKEYQVKIRKTMDAMNLSAEQKSQIGTIMQESRQKFDAILTPEQLAILRHNPPAPPIP